MKAGRLFMTIRRHYPLRRTNMSVHTRAVILRRSSFIASLLALLLAPGIAAAQSDEGVRDSMHRAVKFFREQVSSHGGYVYRCSEDLSKREGEDKVGADTAWIQPPGTPAVGIAYLEAYHRCGDPILLEAAKETAGALIRGQLQSGGWDNMIEFDPQERAKYAYRVEATDNASSRRRNTTTFDDNKSQSAAGLLMRLDQTLQFQDPVIHEAAIYALDCFVKAQYSNGAWPQRYSEFPESTQAANSQASIDPQWSREFPGDKYAAFYTLNDNTMSDMIATMLDASEIYADSSYLQAAIRGGEFFLRAQLPEPQPGWAQQYDQQMHPAWARKFEPPAVSGGESQSVMSTLILLYRRTANSSEEAERFLDPLPRALAYYRRSLLEDGRLARFYELATNRPLFFTREYALTYSASDLPTHYAFIVDSKLDKIQAEFDRVRALPKQELWRPKVVGKSRRTDSLNQSVQQSIAAMDSRGAWVESGRLKTHGDDDKTDRVIRSVTFIKNLNALAAWLGGE